MTKKSFSSFGLAGLFIAALLAPTPALAANCEKKPDHPSCAGGGGGGGGGAGNSGIIYTVAVKADPAWFPTEPTYAPADLDPPCLAETPNERNFTALYPRHDLCATVTTSTGAQLTDDITIQVLSHKGLLTSVQLRGQDVIGEEDIMHESEQVALLPPPEPDPAGFTIHVHADSLPVWKLRRHLGGKRVEIIGYVSIADMAYIPK